VFCWFLIIDSSPYQDALPTKVSSKSYQCTSDMSQKQHHGGRGKDRHQDIIPPAVEALVPPSCAYVCQCLESAAVTNDHVHYGATLKQPFVIALSIPYVRRQRRNRRPTSCGSALTLSFIRTQPTVGVGVDLTEILQR